VSTELVVMDVGGTHARFARAGIAGDGTIALGEPVTQKTSDYASLRTAWEEFERREDKPVPRAASIAIAAPITGDTIRMTNNSWIFSPSGLDEQLGLDAVTLINDFGAVAHAVARAPESEFAHVTGPEMPLPARGTVSVIGAGTGLGVAHFHRFEGGYHVVSTEGGHIDFAPLDAIEDRMLAKLRKEHRRVSTERVNSGPGIAEIYATLAELEKRPVEKLDDKTIWERGIDRSDALSAAAVDRFCATFGAVCGDSALAQGAGAVVLAGSLGLRLRELLPISAFGDRFRFKGRYERMMAGIPVKLITHPQPGLYGAAAAFASEHRV
jgi:glucokinase